MEKFVKFVRENWKKILNYIIQMVVVAFSRVEAIIERLLTKCVSHYTDNTRYVGKVARLATALLIWDLFLMIPGVSPIVRAIIPAIIRVAFWGAGICIAAHFLKLCHTEVMAKQDVEDASYEVVSDDN